MSDLWEILVPTIHSDTGKPITVRFHRVWDAKVREISDGMTIMTPAKGQWISPNNTLFQERMIPVRVIASRIQIEKIVEHTLTYYKQQAILAYKLSDEVILKRK